jgi:hypothetical protein
MSKKCITNCYKIIDTNRRYLHPFLGINIDKTKKENASICVKQKFTNTNNFIKYCEPINKYENNVINVIKNIIDPTEYLSLYYKLNNIDDIIEYLKKNKQISIYTKIRILDLTYIKYGENIENDILKWIDLLKIILDENLSDKTELTFGKSIVDVLKKLKDNPELNTKNYPFNLLLKFKKYLDNNI